MASLAVAALFLPAQRAFAQGPASKTFPAGGVPRRGLPHSVHAKPYVWIGANEERISYGAHASISGRDRGDIVRVTGAHGDATSQLHPEYPDVTRALTERCSDIVITDDLRAADYAVAIERSHAGHLVTQRNTFSVFRQRNDNLLLSGKTTWLKNAATEICNAISGDLDSGAALEPVPSAAVEEPSEPAATGTGTVAVASTPAGAEVWIDGRFVGQTPSTITLPAGSHHVEVKDSGAPVWSRDLNLLRDSQVNLRPVFGTPAEQP